MAFLLALGLGLVLTPLAGRVGSALGLVDRPSGELKIHDRPVPVLGGAAVVAAALAAQAVAGGFHGPTAVAVLLALAVGHADDARSLPPWVRVVGLLGAGGLLALGGARVEPLGPLAGAAVPLLALACANAVNLVDGQDGLAGGLAACAALGLAGAAAVGSFQVAAELSLAGAALGFLVWNRPPARVFLGNGGAYALGVALAAAAGRASIGGWPGLLAAGVALAVLAFELGLTVIRRLARRSPLTRGDRAHSYDLLAERLGSRGRSTGAFLLAGAACAGLAPALAAAPLAVGWAVAGTLLAGAAGVGAWALRRTEERETAWTSS